MFKLKHEDFSGFMYNKNFCPLAETKAFLPKDGEFPELQDGVFEIVGIKCQHGYEWENPEGLDGSLGFEDDIAEETRCGSKPWWVDSVIYAGGDFYVVTESLPSPNDWDCPQCKEAYPLVCFLLRWQDDDIEREFHL